MTFIKLDPNLMQGLIKNLESYADEAERARSNIHSSSVNNSHPVPEVDDATYLPAIFTVTSADAPTSRMMDTLNSMSINSNTGSSYNTTMGATINALGEVIDGLQERLQVIIDLNTDGISTTSSDGVPGYYLPDGTADTVENVKTYNTEAVATARADADALTQAAADGKADDGRTVDEVLASMATYQDSPVYGAAVVTEAGGAQAYLDLLYSVNDYYENDYKGECPEDHFQVASQVLGYVLAAASQWEGGTLADDLYETIDSQNGAPGNMAAINMLLSAPAAHYGTDFLTNLADKLEDRDPDALVPAYQVFANNKTSTSDPMDGVLTAMGGNPQAAVEYLTPHGGSADDAARVEELMSHDDLGDNKWTDIWAKIAECTSSAYAGECVEGGAKGSWNASCAAALSATVVNTIGEATNEVSEAAREDLTSTVAAYPWSVDQTARTDGSSNEPVIMPASVDGNGDATWSYGMSYQPQFTSKGLSGVMQAISRDADDFQTVVDSVATLEQRRMTFEAGVISAATDGQGLSTDATMPTGLNNAIKANSATAAFFQGASRAVVEDDAEEVDNRNKTIVDTLFGLSSFIPGPGGEVSRIWKDTWSFGKDTTKRIAQNAATQDFTEHLTNAIDESKIAKNDASRATTLTTITQMIGLGIISAGQANAAVPGLVGGDGILDSSKLDGTALDTLYDRFVTNGDDTVNPDLHDQLTDAGDAYKTGYDRGHGE